MKELMCVKPLTYEDLPHFSGTGYASMPEKVKLGMLSDSQAKQYADGNYFEVFTLRDGTDVIGFISLYSKESGAVSVGLVIREQYRRQGYGTRSAVPIAELLAEKEFAVIRNTVRTDNEPVFGCTKNLALHLKINT